jgi:uncharacterized protein YdeI (YjbR/CyaY-like superfamily)
MQDFISSIYKEGSNYLIEIPKEIGLSFKRQGYIPVKVKFQDKIFKSTMINRRNEKFVLFLNSEIRKTAKINEYDVIKAAIEFDPEPRDIAIPEDVELLLSENRIVYSTFLNMSTAHRNEILKYILEAKKPESRLKRINKMIDHILNRVTEISY